MTKPTKEHNLLVLNPRLAKQWHPKKNEELRPQDVTPGSGRKVWWICERGHEWQSRVADRVHGYGCPFCRGLRQGKLGLAEWVAENKKIGFGKAIRKVQELDKGKVLVEMPREAFENISILTLPPEDLGPLVLEYRRRYGLTQDEFGKTVGSHRNSIRALEQGKIERFSYNTLKRIISVVLEE